MYKQCVYLLLSTCILVSACSQEDPVADPIEQVPSSAKQIVSFHFKEIDTTRIVVKITDDSVQVSVPRIEDLAALTPVFTFKGVKVEPISGVADDFRSIKKITVTAQDGTQKTYHVKVKVRDAIFIGGLKQLLALDSKDGSLLWKDNTDENFTYSTPLLVGDTLYAGNISGYMCAFHVRSGEVIWRKFLAATGIEGPATVDGNTLYVGHNDDEMMALNAATGEVKWHFQTGSNVSSKPLIFQNMVIFGSADGFVYALNATHGDFVWKYETGDMIVSSSPVLSNGVIFIGSRNNRLFAIDAATGKMKWTYNTGVSMEQSKPVVWNNTVYAAGWYDVSNGDPKVKGSLYAVDEQTGDPKWNALDALGFSAHISIANGVLYVSADDGNLYAVNASTGDVVWSNSIFPNGAGATIKNGVAYVGGGGSRNIYAFDALTGKTLWTYPIPDDLMTSDPAVGRAGEYKGISISL